MDIYSKISYKTKEAKRKLESMSESKGRQFLKKFLEDESEQLKNKDVNTVIQKISGQNSYVNKFAELLADKNDRGIFKEAIEAQAKSFDTKKSGLFYTKIYQNGKLNMEALCEPRNVSKIKTFLLARNDKEDINDPEVINDDDKQSHRMKHSCLGAKLGSSRLSDRLKVFMALVLWRHILVLRKRRDTSSSSEGVSENHGDNKTISGISENPLITTELTHKIEKIQSALHLADGETMEIDVENTSATKETEKMTENKDISGIQNIAFWHLNRLSEDYDNCSIVRIPEGDKYLQYALNSYAKMHGKHHFFTKELYCSPFGEKYDKLDVGQTFTVTDYVVCRFLSFSERKLYKIEVPNNAVVLTDEYNSALGIIPPKTTFKVVENDTGIIDRKCLKIVRQSIPKAPSNKEIDEFTKDSYLEAERAQTKAWNELEPQKPVLMYKGQEPDVESGKKPFYDASMFYNPFSKYIHLLGKIQLQTLSEQEEEALSKYTVTYEYTEEMMSEIDSIFEKIEPLSARLIVFRAMDEDEMQTLLCSYESNRPYKCLPTTTGSINRFLSTTVNPWTALHYQQHPEKTAKGKGLLKLIIPEGKKALISELTARAGTLSFQVILQRCNANMKINKVSDKDGFKFIEATLL